jgi:environmental stress-induced protein Ves
VRLLRAADRAAVPWKNGGGVTYEVAADPPGAGFADFGWRVSTAVVASEGPFSRFEGIDRTLILLDGAGLTLDIAGRAVALSPDSPPLQFDGAAPVQATLASGPILDLNVMVRRGVWASTVTRRSLAAGARFVASEVALVMALADVAVTTADGPVSLSAKDALRLEAGEHAELAAPATLVMAEFRRSAAPRSRPAAAGGG